MPKILAALVVVFSITGTQLAIAQPQPQTKQSRGRVALGQLNDSLEALADQCHRLWWRSWSQATDP